MAVDATITICIKDADEVKDTLKEAAQRVRVLNAQVEYLLDALAEIAPESKAELRAAMELATNGA